jgi:hypothetical protein
MRQVQTGGFKELDHLFVVFCLGYGLLFSGSWAKVAGGVWIALSTYVIIYCCNFNCHKLGTLDMKFSPQMAVFLIFITALIPIVFATLMQYESIAVFFVKLTSGSEFLFSLIGFLIEFLPALITFLVWCEIFKVSIDYKNWKAAKIPKGLFIILLFPFKSFLDDSYWLFFNLLIVWFNFELVWQAIKLQKAAIARFMQERETQTA